MKLYRSARWLLLALLLPLIPATRANAGVFISVGFAPPVLPVYVQPPCPEPNLMWVPGYWAYGPDGYYWVPGAWVPAPYEGALWTPPYWGYEGAVYVFHPGYWGWHVGYYGGVNYGFGYFGRGFVGGVWHGGIFAYNTAVVRVNTVVIRNVYVDRTVIRDHEIAHGSRVAYNGGPGGIRYQPSAEERAAMREQHVPPTQAQQQRIREAQTNRAAYFNANHGRPQEAAMARPLAQERVAPPPARGENNSFRQQQPQYRQPEQQRQQQQPQYRQPEQQRQQPQYRPQPQSRPAPESRPRAEQKPRQESRPERQPKESKHPQR